MKKKKRDIFYCVGHEILKFFAELYISKEWVTTIFFYDGKELITYEPYPERESQPRKCWNYQGGQVKSSMGKMTRLL